MLPNISCIDGQHRHMPHSSIMNGQENLKENHRCPTIEANCKGMKPLPNISTKINITEGNGITPDYVRGAANINPDIEYSVTNELIKRKEEPRRLSNLNTEPYLLWQ